MIHPMGGGWVRFVFEEAVETEVYLVGDFNGWNEYSHRMERQADATHQLILKVDPGEYEFKYRCGGAWFNDPHAHKYVPNCWGSENSVLVVAPEESKKAGPIAPRLGGPSAPPIHPGL